MKKTENITTAALILGSSILLSRILGYLREMLLAYKFGASATTDAFYAAFQIPDLLNYFLAGGALSIAFIPLYNRVLAKSGDKAANDLMANVLGTLGLIVVMLTGILWVEAEALVRFQFPKFNNETVALTVHLTRIVLPAQIFFITGGIIQAVLMAHKNFHAAALAPLIYNACTILGGYFLYPICGISGFAIGTLAGSVLGPFLMPVLFSFRHIPLRLRLKPKERDFVIYLAMAAPLMFGQTLLTLDEWYGRWFGALLATGTVAHISYARRLMQVPIAVIGQAVGAAALPTLAKLWSEDRLREMNDVLLQTIKTGLALSVLAGAGFFAVAQPLVALVYEHGAFTHSDGESVSALTAIFTFAIPGWILQQISIRAFYARGDTWRPMVLGTLLSLAVIPLYMSLAKSMGVNGLALAGAIGMTLNALATLLFARLRHKAPEFKPLLAVFASSFCIAVPSALASLTVLYLRPQFWDLSGSSHKFVAVVDLCAAGAAFGSIALPCIFLFGEAGLKNYFHKITFKLFGRLA